MLHHGQRDGVVVGWAAVAVRSDRDSRTLCRLFALSLGERIVLPHTQLDAAHGIDGDVITGPHQHRGELRFQDGGPGQFRPSWQ